MICSTHLPSPRFEAGVLKLPFPSSSASRFMPPLLYSSISFYFYLSFYCFILLLLPSPRFILHLHSETGPSCFCLFPPLSLFPSLFRLCYKTWMSLKPTGPGATQGPPRGLPLPISAGRMRRYRLSLPLRTPTVARPDPLTVRWTDLHRSPTELYWVFCVHVDLSV